MDRQRWHRNNVPDARRLRRPMTPTEATLWSHLRGRGLQGLKFRRQHPVDNFVLDFYCAEQRLAVEIDGPVHNDPEQQRRDRSREAILNDKGIRILRIPAAAVDADIAAVLQRIAHAAAPPSPQPSPPSRERE